MSFHLLFPTLLLKKIYYCISSIAIKYFVIIYFVRYYNFNLSKYHLILNIHIIHKIISVIKLILKDYILLYSQIL